MKKNFIIISILSGIMCLLISVSIPDAWARELMQPLVVRKKIEPQKQNSATANGGLQSGILSPKSDLALIRNESTANQISLSTAGNENRIDPLYDPTGKIDPFEPLYAETPAVKQRGPKYAITNQKPLTELEKIDLSQIEVTGVILAKSGNRGLVREASGKGHIITEGTPIGRHGGKVAGIFSNYVVIEQKMVDFQGKELVEKREFKIHK
jgi:Tfp pilus assembly protein PilP